MDMVIGMSIYTEAFKELRLEKYLSKKLAAFYSELSPSKVEQIEIGDANSLAVWEIKRYLKTIVSINDLDFREYKKLDRELKIRFLTRIYAPSLLQHELYMVIKNYYPWYKQRFITIIDFINRIKMYMKSKHTSDTYILRITDKVSIKVKLLIYKNDNFVKVLNIYIEYTE
jgi:hypothetical protein